MASSQLSLCVLVLLGLQACTHVSYTRGSMSTTAVSVDDGGPPDGTPFDFTANEAHVSTNEIALLDSTGSMCASLLTGLDQAASAEGRRKKAARDREFGILSYKYKVVAPGEFGGYPCGVFYKWGTVNSMTGLGGRGAATDPGFGEGGLTLYGWDEAFDGVLPGLYFGGGTRPSMGVYSTDKVGSGDVARQFRRDGLPEVGVGPRAQGDDRR